jgi:hypothetical protein
VTDFDGEGAMMATGDTLAANAQLHADLLGVIGKVRHAGATKAG